ncbi:MAG TPA: SPOR domain-containing protein [Desulfuromonadales bacterium]|nr:SPOR domain-containing protein [Desulfuromonadales bacterium]
MSQEEDFFNSENPNNDPLEEQEMPEPVTGGKGGSRRRLLLLVLLLLVIVAGALFYLGPGLLKPEIAQTPAPPPPKKDVVKLPPPESSDKAPAIAEGTPAPEKEVEKEEIPEQSVVAVEKVESPPNKGSDASAESPAAEEQTGTAEIVGEAVAGTGKQKGDYALQAGAFLLDSNLKSAEAAVEKLGYESRHTRESRKVEMTRLKVGSFDEETARAKLEDFRHMAPDAFIMKKDGTVNLYAGSFYSLDRARAFADGLYAEGIQVEEEKVEVELPLTIVRFGAFEDRSEARRAASRARDKGLDVAIVKKR